MAHLWVANTSNDVTVDAAATGWQHQPVAATMDLGSSARLVRASTRDGGCWVVIGPPSVRINGLALAAGLAVVRDRDAITLDGQRLFFSTEVLAVVVPCPARERALQCPRCKTAIEVGSPAVACPRCELWHHQTDELACWSYEPTCAACDQATALDAGYRFTPEAL